MIAVITHSEVGLSVDFIAWLVALIGGFAAKRYGRMHRRAWVAVGGVVAISWAVVAASLPVLAVVWGVFVVPPCARESEAAALTSAGTMTATTAIIVSNVYLGLRRSGVVALPLWVGLTVAVAPGLVAAGVLARGGINGVCIGF